MTALTKPLKYDSRLPAPDQHGRALVQLRHDLPGAGDGARCGARGALLRERSCWPHGQLGGWTVPVRCFLGGSDRRHDQQPSIAGTRTQVLVGIGCGPLLAIKNL